MSGRDDHLRWTELSRRTVATSAVFDLLAAERTGPGGRRGEFWLLDAPDWVNVVPVVQSPGGAAFIMVRQYRHGAGMVTTEFPAGIVERGEDPAAAAARELREETGHRAGRLTLLGSVQPNPAFMGNWCHTYLAEELEPDATARQDELELLEAITLPVAVVEERMGSGEFVNALAVVALGLWQRHAAGRA